MGVRFRVEAEAFGKVTHLTRVDDGECKLVFMQPIVFPVAPLSSAISICKPLLHRDGHPGAAFFRKEDTVVTDLSSIAAGEIRNRFCSKPTESVPATNGTVVTASDRQSHAFLLSSRVRKFGLILFRVRHREGEASMSLA